MPNNNIYILTKLQFINFIFWFIHSYYPFLPFLLQAIYLLFIGILAGLMYLYAYGDIVNSAHDDKSIHINVLSICMSIGVLLSSFFSLIALNTFL